MKSDLFYGSSVFNKDFLFFYVFRNKLALIQTYKYFIIKDSLNSDRSLLIRALLIYNK